MWDYIRDRPMRFAVPAAPTDHFANERTFLAWVRTGITIVALGFVVAKFNLLIRELAGPQASAQSPYASALGIVLVLVGAAMVLLAYTRYVRVRTSLERGEYTPSDALIGGVTWAMVLVGVALAIYLALSA